MNPLLSQLREKRDALKDTLNGITDGVAAEQRDALNEAEQKNFDAALEQIRALDERITQLVEVEERNAKAAEAFARVEAPTATVKVTREEATYRPDVAERSFFRDLVDSRIDPAAMERIQRNNAEQRTTATSGLAGFVPPAYLVNDYVNLARASRPVANLMPSAGAPYTNLMYVPKLTSGLSVDFQSSENATLANADMAASNVTVAARTLGGYVDVTRQTLDLGQFPDREIFGDLAAVLATQVETMVLNSSTSNNEGILQTSGITSVTYTDSTPTVAELMGKVGYAVSQIHTNVYAGPQVIIMDPTMWNWIKSRSDSNLRPLVPTVAPQNTSAVFGSFGAEGIVGEFFGLPVCVSSSVPLVAEATPSKRQIIIARIADSRLWESVPTTDVFTDVGSATLSVRFRIHNYVAQTHARRPKDFAVISGTGTAIDASAF